MQGTTTSFGFPVPFHENQPQIASPPRLFVRTPSWPADADFSADQRHGLLSSSSSTKSAKTMEETQDALWQNLAEFYEQNRSTIERSLALDLAAQNNLSDIDAAIDSFVETANVVLPGLVALANVHPAIGVAVFAFHGVISLDIARRNNNRKVLAVKLQMQNMMCAMFQLRKLRHIHLVEPERGEERNRLQDLIKSIADEIKMCGSDLDYYMDRKFVSKLINATKYERRFADHVETFARRRSELQSTVTAYIAASVDSANMAIAEMDEKLGVMDYKLDNILACFRNLDTSREREVRIFIEDNKGPKSCVANDELLASLLKKADVLPMAGNTMMTKGQDFIEIRESLKTEINEELDVVLANNLARFEKLLNVQNNNFQRIMDHMEQQGYELADHTSKLDKLVTTTISILEEEKYIRKATGPTAPLSFNDPILQSIWRQMGLKGSVKAKTFVLTLRDHFFNNPHSPASTIATPISQLYTPFGDANRFFDSGTTTPRLSPHELQIPMDAMLAELADRWVLEYIDIAHVQPIVEAIDEDSSGYISVKEANKFAISRPKGWSFLRWVGYWAAGYHINTTNYRRKIYSVVQKMHEILPSVHVGNRAYVDGYLSHSVFDRLEALLRSINPVPDSAPNDSRMMEVADTMSKLVENRLMANLKVLSFVVESPGKVSLVAGSGRVETWILPLLYLILTQHLKIIALAETHVLHERELSSHVASLESIFTIFDERIRKLESLFRTHMQQDLKVQFEKFAHRMFLVTFMETEKNPAGNTLLTFKDNKISFEDIYDSSNGAGAGDTTDAADSSSDVSILTMGLGPSFEFEEVEMRSDTEPRYGAPHPLEGIWTGECFRINNMQIAFQGFFQCNIDEIIGGMITGKGETYLGEIELYGNVYPDDDGDETSLYLDFKVLSDKYSSLWCRGRYDSRSEVISGQWVIDDKSGKFPPYGNEEEEKRMDLRLPCGRFLFTRTPASVFRFRRILDSEGSDPPRDWTLARRRWLFAIESVRLQTQQRLGSGNLHRTQMSERRTWITLAMRRELDNASSTTSPQLSEEGKEKLSKLKLQMSPGIGRLYDSLAAYLFRRMVYHIGPYNCYSCERRIIFSRYQCITCMDEKLSSQIDLCADCIAVPLFSGKTEFAHDISHSLMRSMHHVHDCQLVSMLPQARIRSEKVKALFFEAGSGATRRPVEPNIPAGSPVATSPKAQIPVCVCCNVNITLPCWICVSCTLDTFICLDCDLNRRSALHNNQKHDSGSHRFYHPLLRIHDSKPVQSADSKVNKLERQLQDMEMRINHTLSALTQKMTSEMTNTMRDLTWGTAMEKRGGGMPLISPVAEVNAEMVSAESMQDKISRRKTIGALAAKRRKNTEQTTEGKLEQRLVALENKVDQQFGQLLSLMQQLLPAGSMNST